MQVDGFLIAGARRGGHFQNHHAFKGVLLEIRSQLQVILGGCHIIRQQHPASAFGGFVQHDDLLVGSSNATASRRDTQICNNTAIKKRCVDVVLVIWRHQASISYQTSRIKRSSSSCSWAIEANPERGVIVALLSHVHVDGRECVVAMRNDDDRSWCALLRA